MGLLSTLRKTKQWDDQRPGIPGEHWLALGAGLFALARARRSRSPVVRLAGQALGGALMARAASGRDGIAGKLARARR